MKGATLWQVLTLGSLLPPPSGALCQAPSPYYENFGLRQLLVLDGCKIKNDEGIPEIQRKIEENHINNFGLSVYSICSQDNSTLVAKAKQTLVTALWRVACLQIPPPIGVVSSQQFAALQPLAKSLGVRFVVATSELASTTMSEIRKYNSVDKDISCTSQKPPEIANGGWMGGLAWRTPPPWLSAAAAVSVLGSLAALAIGVFLTVLVCRGHVLEGHPGLSYILLISIVLSYAYVLPYSVTVPEISETVYEVNSALSSNDLSSVNPSLETWIIEEENPWTLELYLELSRILWPGITCGLLFSGMASRSIMLASCDSDGGLITHINGYLQTTIFFFMYFVQISISGLLVAVAPVGLHLVLPVTLSYTGFLLLIMVLLVPWMKNSRRNYGEGKHLCACILIIFLVWISWLTIALLLPAEWHEYCHVIGVQVTSTLVLVMILVPRTYAMTAALSRDRVTAAIPPAVLCGLNTGQQMDNFRPICEMATVNQLSRNSPAVVPMLPTTSTQNPANNDNPENTYTRFDTPPNPLKITHF